MTVLSVNVNKVATVRNARGGRAPDPARAARVALEAGAPGVTVHPRADRRHITPDDVRAVAAVVAEARAAGRPAELNVEGDPRPELLELAHAVRPDQLTLVPVRPGEITSEAGWPPDTPLATLRRVVTDAQRAGMRVSIFVDPAEAPIRWAAALGADRVELYTEPYARAFGRGPEDAEASFARYAEAAEAAHARGLGVNAGHDLDLDNLRRFRALPHLDEVSIGHALVAEAIFDGLAAVVRAYLALLDTR